MRTLPSILLALLAAPLLGGCMASNAPPPMTVIVVQPPAPMATPPEDADPPPAGFGRVARIAAGLEGRIFALPEGTQRLPDFEGMTPLGSIYTTALDVTARRFDQGFPGVSDRFEWFGIDYRGTFTVTTAGDYRFRLTADDGAKLFVDDKLVLDDDGVHPPTAVEGRIHLNAGAHRLHVPYFQGPRWEIALVLEVAPAGETYRVLRVDRPVGPLPTEDVTDRAYRPR